jgi:hypothetical protein
MIIHDNIQFHPPVVLEIFKKNSANQRLLCPLAAMLDGWSEQKLYSILWSWYTSRPLGMPPYSICKWYCIHVRVVVLGYIIHYRCRTTCMISTILQYGKEMADINANNIFHKKATVEACQPSRPNSCWIGPMMVIFSVEYGQMAQVSKPIRLLLQIKISKKKATNEPRWAITGSWFMSTYMSWKQYKSDKSYNFNFSNVV